MLFKQYKCSCKLLEDLSDEVLKIPQNKIHKHFKYNDDNISTLTIILFVSYDSERAVHKYIPPLYQ